MARGPTTKCPFCHSALSFCYVKVPRSGVVEFSENVYHCRVCQATVVQGSIGPGARAPSRPFAIA